MAAETSVPRPTVGVGVLDDPSVAACGGYGWLLKRASTDVGEGVLTLPLAGTARNGGEDGWLVQPTFSQTATQGRAGTPAPTTWSGRVRNVYRRVSSHTICCEVVIVIPTFSSVPRKGRRGRRPLRLGGKRTFPQPSILVLPYKRPAT